MSRAKTDAARRVRLSRAGRFQPPPDWILGADRTTTWTDLDLWYLQTGYGRAVTPDGTFDLLPGSCLVMRGGEPYTLTDESDGPFVHYWAHFDCLDPSGRRVPPRRARVPRRFRQLDDPSFVEALFTRLLDSYLGGRIEDASAWLQAALLELDRIDGRRGDEDAPPDEVRSRVDRLRRAIDHDPQKRWSVVELADAFGACRSHLYRAFVAVTGRSPQQYVLEARMRAARMLLTESGNSIGWVADRLGYRDVYFFSRQFKRFHGKSPTAFRG
jgi:AraC-like DNA-binding protein